MFTPTDSNPAQRSNGAAQDCDFLVELHRLQRQRFEQVPIPPAAERIARIDRLILLIAQNRDQLIDALDADYGHRSPVQSMASDLLATINALRHSRRRVTKWMEPTRNPLGLGMAALGVRTQIRWKPKGVVGIVAPWNFPVTLSLQPLGQALAAGNSAMVKLSERVPETANVLARAIADAFDPAELTAVTGGPDVAARFCALPLDHLFFTGSTQTGLRVMKAAADNLTPVTLELGGRSPVVAGPGTDLNRLARSLVFGKTLNAGQFCVAPNHLYLPKQLTDDFVQAARSAAQTMYPGGPDLDYTAVIDSAHRTRLEALIKDAESQGANVIRLLPCGGTENTVVPTLVIGADASMNICQEELFGPVLPVLNYDSVEEIVDNMRKGGHPLAAYWFGADSPERRRFLDTAVAGGVTLNEIMLHVGLEGLPFGGAGASGMGKYHGRAGFEEFSHAVPVVEIPPAIQLGKLAAPPYGPRASRLIRSAIGAYGRVAEFSVRRHSARGHGPLSTDDPDQT